MAKYVFHIIRELKSNEMFRRSVFFPITVLGKEDTHSVLLTCTSVTVSRRGQNNVFHIYNFPEVGLHPWVTLRISSYHRGLNLETVKLLNLSVKFVCCILRPRDRNLLLSVLSFWNIGFVSEAIPSLVLRKVLNGVPLAAAVAHGWAEDLSWL